MEFLGNILGALGGAVAGVASGGILSLLTAGIKGISGYFTRKQEQAFRREEWEREERIRRLEMEKDTQDTENEIKLANAAGSWSGLEASYRTTIPATSVHMWVNDIRSLFRPLLTVLMLGLVLVIYNSLMALFQGDESFLSAVFTPGEASAAIKYIVYSIVYTACTSVTWWYGDRALTPTSLKGR